MGISVGIFVLLGVVGLVGCVVFSVGQEKENSTAKDVNLKLTVYIRALHTV